MSTARHQLAGAPGTGTTIDNMASRAKAWLTVNQVGTMANLASLNITSIGDGGLGQTSFVFTAPMANALYVVVPSANSAGGRISRHTTASTTGSGYSCYDQTTNADFTLTGAIVTGDLA